MECYNLGMSVLIQLTRNVFILLAKHWERLQKKLDKVLCLIFIHYTGWVPLPCDCTDGEENKVHTVKNEKAH